MKPLLFAVLLALPQLGWACSCISSGSPQRPTVSEARREAEWYLRYESVLRLRAVKDVSTREERAKEERRYEFLILDAYRGPYARGDVLVLPSNAGTSCDMQVGLESEQTVAFNSIEEVNVTGEVCPGSFPLERQRLLHRALTKLAPRPSRINACELLANPAAYDRRLVEVTGRVSRAREDFTLHTTAACAEKHFVRLVYLSGNDPLSVDGAYASLKQNATFKRFDWGTLNLKAGETLQATLIGRVFVADTAGADSSAPSRFVIQQVANVREP